MPDVIYEIVQHDGGWAYKVDGVFSESFPTHAEALAAAQAAAEEQEAAMSVTYYVALPFVRTEEGGAPGEAQVVGQKKAIAIAVRNVLGRRRWSKLSEWLVPKTSISMDHRKQLER